MNAECYFLQCCKVEAFDTMSDVSSSSLDASLEEHMSQINQSSSPELLLEPRWELRHHSIPMQTPKSATPNRKVIPNFSSGQDDSTRGAGVQLTEGAQQTESVGVQLTEGAQQTGGASASAPQQGGSGGGPIRQGRGGRRGRGRRGRRGRGQPYLLRRLSKPATSTSNPNPTAYSPCKSPN